MKAAQMIPAGRAETLPCFGEFDDSIDQMTVFVLTFAAKKLSHMVYGKSIAFRFLPGASSVFFSALAGIFSQIAHEPLFQKQ